MAKRRGSNMSKLGEMIKDRNAKPIPLPKKKKSIKPSMVKPGTKKPSIKPKKDITKIPGFKFGRGTE
jgi:hypothetical protein